MVISRTVPLAVAVDAAVALLDADQAPRDVVVDQLVALQVQVDALGGDVAGDRTRMGEPACLKLSTTPAARRRLSPPCSTSTSVGLEAELLLQLRAASSAWAPARRRSPRARPILADADLAEVADQSVVLGVGREGLRRSARRGAPVRRFSSSLPVAVSGARLIRSLIVGSRALG